MKKPKYKIISCNVLWRELCYFSALSKNEFEFVFLPHGLHDTPDRLREEVQNAIDETEDGVDAILLGYGLCSKGLEGIIAKNCPLVAIRGHDCITCFLGSKERYRDYFDANPGTYWYTPGWIGNQPPPGKDRHEANYRHYVEKYGETTARDLMEMDRNCYENYSKAVYVDLGVGNTVEYEKYTRECADWLNWEFEKIDGDARLIQRFVSGDWDEDSFIIVDPGYMIERTYDESIMKSVKQKPDPDRD